MSVVDRVCVREHPFAQPPVTELVLRRDCASCEDLHAACLVALEPRFTDLPPGGELRIVSASHPTRCETGCPAECLPAERRCPVPPLEAGHFYRVWSGDEVLTSFTAGALPPCDADPIPPGG